MKLDDYLEREGDHEGEYIFNREHYSTSGDLLQCGLLDFCGCGKPAENLEYVRKGLELLEESSGKKVAGMSWKEYDEIMKAWLDRCLKHFGNECSMYFFWYWCDHMKYEEHGGSVPGYLTERGKKLLDLLNEYRDETRKKDER